MKMAVSLLVVVASMATVVISVIVVILYKLWVLDTNNCNEEVVFNVV